MDYFKNCDNFGPAEWFARMANAIRDHDKAVVAKDGYAAEMYRNIALSSLMRLVREYEQQVATALREIRP